MPRYNVTFPDGTWRVWSSVVDDWVSERMTFAELARWRFEQYGDTPETTEENDSLLTDNPIVNKVYAESESEDDVRRGIMRLIDERCGVGRPWR